jgi:DNA-binding response OmpR family regulator
MATDDKKPLGRILLQQKLVTPDALEGALEEQVHQTPDRPKPLASRLAERGAVKEVDALRALSQQHGVPGIDLTQIAIHLDALDLIPREIAEAHLILPALVKEDRIFLAMATPNDKRVVDELEFVTGKKVYPYVALSTTLEKTIRSAFEAKAAGETYWVGPNVPEQTLKQLGLAPRPTAERHDLETSRPTAPPPTSSGRSDSIAPGAPGIVVDEAMEKVGFDAEIETASFGTLDREEVSTVTRLPDELRGGSATAQPGRAPAPAAAPSPARPPPPAASAIKVMPGTGSKVILVVDDEEDIRKLLKRLLADKGHRVVEADRGLLALRMVKEHTPDLIILDAMLPELHGFDIARRIKGSEKYGQIPIIMVSAVYRGWRIAEDLKTNYGIEEYIEKPFRITDVLKAVQKLIAQREQAKRDSPASSRDPEAVSAEAEKSLNDGIAAYRAGEIDEAIEHLKHGVQLDPLAYRLRYHLGLLYGKKGMVYEGISELERAVDLNPKHFPALKNLAVLYEKAGFKHKAVEMWERCAHNAPDDATRDSIKKHLMELL